jgi:hypothetical protein
LPPVKVLRWNAPTCPSASKYVMQMSCLQIQKD